MRERRCSRAQMTKLRSIFWGISFGLTLTVELWTFFSNFRSLPEVKEVFKTGQDPANFQWGSIGHHWFKNYLNHQILWLCWLLKGDENKMNFHFAIKWILPAWGILSVWYLWFGFSIEVRFVTYFSAWSTFWSGKGNKFPLDFLCS